MTPTPNIWFYEAGFNTPRMCLVKFYSLWDLHKQEAILVIRTARPLYIGCFFFFTQTKLCYVVKCNWRLDLCTHLLDRSMP